MTDRTGPLKGWLSLFLVAVILLAFLLAAIMTTPAAAAGTTSVTVTRYASDGTTILDQITVTYIQMMNSEYGLPVMGDGATHYYMQGPVFLDDPDEATEQALRWNPAEDTNIKDMGAVKGTNVVDLCNLVGGATSGETIRIKASDGMYKTFTYENVYEYSSREGPMVLTWYMNGLYPNTGWTDGMRILWFADDSVFGNWDWHEAADSADWYYYISGSEQYPTTTGLSVKYVSSIMIYSNEEPPATSTPTPTQTPTPTPTPAITPTSTLTSTVAPTPTPTQATTTTPTAIPAASSTPTYTTTLSPTATPEETPTGEVTPTIVVPTETPEVTPTSTPTITPAPTLIHNDNDKDNGIGAGVIAGLAAMSLLALGMLTWIIVVLLHRRA